MQRPLLILMRGLPGSGKSYIAERLARQLGPNQVIELDPDATDYDSPAYAAHVARATAENVDPRLHAYRYLRQQAWDGIEAGNVIIWNQPFTNLEIFDKMTAGLQAYAAEHGAALRILVVEVMIDPDLARQRVLERKQQGGHGPSDATFERFVADYRSFAPDGYQTVTVQGTDEVSVSLATITAAITEQA